MGKLNRALPLGGHPCRPRGRQPSARRSYAHHGVWTIYDIFSKGGVWVNGERADDNGLTVEDGDAINLAGNVIRFYDTTPEKRQKLEEKREAAGLAVSPALTLFDLTLFELLLLAQYVYSAARENLFPIALAFGTLILLLL